MVINRTRHHVAHREHRIHKAEWYSLGGSSAGEQLALADRLEPRLRRRFKSLLRVLSNGFQNRVSENLIVRLLSAGNEAAIMDVVGNTMRSVEFTEAWTEASTLIMSGMEEGAQVATEGMLETLGTEYASEILQNAVKLSARIEWTTLNEKTEQAFTQIQDRLRQRIETRAATTVQEAVRDAIRRQVDIPTMAEEVRQVIGLTDRQRIGMNRLREGMRQAGRSPSDIKAATQAYRNRAIENRSKVIARTETMRIQNRAQELQWERAMDAGILGTETKRRWMTAPGACNLCRPMNGRLTGLNEPWITAIKGKEVWNPSFIHPQCRCTEVLDEIQLGPALDVPGGQEFEFEESAA